MSVMVVPPVEKRPWATLGPDVVAHMEELLVFGPGDLRGKPYRVDDEDRALIYRMYEVYPLDHAGPCRRDELGRCTAGAGLCGRRRFKRAGVSRRKGTAKSELGAALGGVELHQEAPVRVDGWRRQGSSWVPVGRPVTDPYIPMVAYTEEQSDDLAYAALFVMLSEGPHADDFDLGNLKGGAIPDRISRPNGDGKAVSLAGSPNARDGARTSFQLKDESHRWDTPRLRDAHRTMLANLDKRIAADPWELEITTRPEPGAGSVAEETEDYARAIARGTIKDPKLFFFLREASDAHDLSTTEGRIAGIAEATGPTKLAWTNLPGIESSWQDPKADVPYLERVWTNRLVKGSASAFDSHLWAQLAVKRPKAVPDGALVVAGFRGSRFRNATALIATEVASGYQWPLGIWERPPLPADVEWEVPSDDVERAVEHLFEIWTVWRLYADPPNWEGAIAGWAGRWGKERVVEWWTNRERAMSYSLRAYATGMRQLEVSHDGDPLFAAHIGHAVRVPTGKEDDEGQLWTIAKDRQNSPNEVAAAIAGSLSWEARNDALTAGALSLKQAEPVGPVFASY